MSNIVDNRVVEMRFDNGQFESGVKTSMSTLERLKNSLKLTEASKGLENLNSAAKNTDFSPLSNGLETVKMKFSALQVMGVTALANITNAAINAGKSIVSAITIDPIKDGFAEYETQMNAVQTILANTQKEGTDVKMVNAALDELNTYADQTIYNFTEMTRNIGTFTAAGVKLDTSVNAIKGIANLAAVSGSTSMQASTAMYQLSQALAAGKVQLMDWNSVVNAGMGGQVFQDALIRTSEHLKTGAKQAIETYGSFRESLTKGEWLTTEVLTETLNQIGGAYSEADLLAQGYTQDQVDEIMKLADTAMDAATKVKTFSQLIDTLKEALGSGWTETWRLIVGDFEEAKELFTSISDTLGNMINESSSARNELVQGWRDLGGREDLIAGFANIWDSLVEVAKVIKEAFREIFPPTTAEQLSHITHGFKTLTEILKPSVETLDRIKRIASGVFSAFSLIGKGVSALLSPITELFSGGGITGLGNMLLEMVASIGDFFTALNKGAGTETFFSGIADTLSTVSGKISEVIASITNKFEGFGSIFSSIGDGISNAVGKIGEVFSTVFGWIKENVSVGDILNGIGIAGFIGLVKSLSSAAKSVKDVMSGGIMSLIFGSGDDDGNDSKSIADNFSNILESVHDSINAFTTGIKVGSLVAIAVAIGILSASLNTLSKIHPADLIKSLSAMTAMMVMLNLSFRSIVKSLSKFDSKGIVKAGAALVLMAIAINKFADALVKISGIPLDDLAKGLVGLGIGLAELCGALKIIGKTKVSLKTSVALIALAQACKMLADALTKFSGLSWDEIGRGLTAMGGALAELVATITILGKVGGGSSLIGAVSILIAVQALDEISEALAAIGSLSWEEIGKGLTGMGGALAELGVITGLLGKLSGFSGLLGAGTIVLAAQSLKPIADTLQQIGSMSWEEIGKGLAGMGGALAELGAASFLTGLGGLSSIVGAGTLDLAVQCLDKLANGFQKFGDMSWDEIGRGLVAMGGALAELGAASFLTGLGGLSSLVGAGTLDLAVQCLDKLATGFQKFGDMSWDQIGQGLVAMGGALAELGAASFLTGLGGIASIAGAGTLDLAVQCLDQLANALQKFGEMSWDEIGQGLAAMGGALGELALGGFLNTFAIFGSGAIAEVAEPLGVLADSVKKWVGVTVPDGLGDQLSSLAGGIGAFNFSGWGASAIAEMAGPLGILADSVKKWAGVIVPEELGDQLSSLAKGVEAFTFGGAGAGTIAQVAEPLGALAASVAMWSAVRIPEGLQENLEGLAKGVQAFSFAALGGWSIDAIKGPLGDLADSVVKWKEVSVPDGLKEDLEDLASGVQAFTLAFVAGWSIDAVKGPLGDLAEAVSKWQGVVIPYGIQKKLEELANGLNAFAGVSADNISEVSASFGDIATAIQTLNGISFETVASGLTSFADSVNNISISPDAFSGFGENVVSGLVTALTIGMPKVAAAAVLLAQTAIKSFQGAAAGASAGGSSAGRSLVTSLASGIRSGIGTVSSAASQVVMLAVSATRSKSSQFQAAGRQLSASVAKGISSGRSSVNAATSGLVSGASSSLRSYHGSFYSAGMYVASGFASGIRSRISSAASAAAAMASAASTAARKNLNINSPSRVFKKIGKAVPEGFALGISTFGSMIDKATNGMAVSAIDGTKTAISQISSVLDGNMDSQPTIRPVVDLTDVKSGAASISNMFGLNPAISAMANTRAINAMMTQQLQNGVNDDVVDAINKLHKSIDNLEGNTTIIDGITYDDGSNIASAVSQLTRAAIMERRI